MAAPTTSLPSGGERYDPDGPLRRGLQRRRAAARALRRRPRAARAHRPRRDDRRASGEHLLDHGCTFDWGEHARGVPGRPRPADLHARGMGGAGGRRRAAGAGARHVPRTTSTASGGSSPRASSPRASSHGADYHEPALGQLRRTARSASGSPAWTSSAPADGHFQVLEDNLRTPSGLAYAMAARQAVLPHVDGGGERPAPVAFEPFAVDALSRALRNAGGGGDGIRAVLLTDGPGNSAYWEHEMLADRLGIPLVTLDDARPRRASTSSTAAPTRTACATTTASSRSVGEALMPGCATGRSPCSTRSATASPTTSSSTPTSRTWSASTCTRSR